jgi:hypothetical protein
VTVLGSAAMLAGACVITSTTTNDTSTTTTHTNEGAGGSIPAGGAGGTGGQISAGGAGGGGGAACVSATGTGVTTAACEDMNITPPPNGQSMLCVAPDYDQPPPGYLVCNRGFEIYTAGQAEDLQACLAQIGVQDACDEALVLACIDQMYNDGCIQADVVTYCTGIATACDPDPFDADQCAADLNPFGEAGLAELTTCFNDADPTLTCQQAYDTCFTTVASAG